MIISSKRLLTLVLGAALSTGLAFTSLITPNTAMAQAVSGDITGVVTDANNSVVVKATVVARDVATGVTYQATTNGIGEYRLNNLAPGSYDLTATAVGFSKSVLKGFDVQLNKTSTANISLKVSAMETIEVSAAAVALDTTTAQVESSFSEQQLTELPAATNNVLNLSLMTAGVRSLLGRRGRRHGARNRRTASARQQLHGRRD